MANYVDGFVLPIPRDCLDEYRELVEAVALVWREHGALDYREYVADDLGMEGVRSFAEAAAASDSETVIFGWVEFESREARDRANEQIAADPRMAKLMSGSDTGFDAERMAFGGFRLLAR